ncbi:MAG TPA: putative porin [Burkholderiales bacterium]|nr:putative porin [Burkholderiales bacterium]
MAFRNKSLRLSNIAAILAAGALITLSAAPVCAQSDPMDDLLEKLKDKGVLSDSEYQALKKAREEEQIELRNERRRQAQKAAQDAAKEEAATQEAAKKPKFDASPGIKSIQLFGDVRLRYESRVGVSSSPSGINSTFVAPGTGADSATLDRWRYAVRIGIRGDLVDDWFYTLRIDTGASNPRSSWVTFGNNTNNAAGGTAPFGRGSDGLVFGQAYLGWRATPWLTLQGGKMANPLFTTPQFDWDPDINPEGLAERINYPVNDKLSLFANFGQFVYQSFSPNGTSGGFGGISNDGYLFAWQGGIGYKFGPETSAKVALTFYNYTGMTPPPQSFLTGTQTNPNGFGGPFAFSPTGNVNTFPSSGPGQTGVNFNNGTNNLRYFDLPVELNFPLGGLSGQFFGGAAYNIQADDRAKKGSFASLGSQAFAYQAGLSVGTNTGLTLNKVAAKKGTWEARGYWQQIDLNSLDPNLIDSDFFEGRTNLQGVFLAFAYSPTDAIITTVRFGEAHRVTSTGPTPGSNPDIPNVQPITEYKLLQLDLTWKF